jgi:hypothetical protein
MAHKSKDSELREAWQEAGAAGEDGMRALVQRVVQQVLEAEMTFFWGRKITNVRASVAGIGTGTSRGC